MAKKVLKQETKKSKVREENRAQIANVCPWHMADNWGYLVINDEFIRMAVISSWPNTLKLNWGENFMNFQDRVLITFAFVKRPNSELQRHLNLTINNNSWQASQVSESLYDRTKREYESSQAEAAMDMIIKTNARLYEVYCYIQMRAKSLEELNELEQTCRQKAASMSLEMTCDPLNQKEMFWAASPYLSADPFTQDRYNFSMPTTTIGRGLLNRDSGLCDPQGIPLGKNKYGAKVIVDFFNTTPLTPNRNVSIIAESGQGKSLLISKIIIYALCMLGYRVIINDVDNEYGWLTRKLHGFNVDAAGDSTGVNFLISPFVPRNTLATSIDTHNNSYTEDEEIRLAHEEAQNVHVLASHIPFIVNFLIKNFSLTEDHKHILTIATTWAYNTYGITNDMTFAQYNESNYSYPVLTDIYQQLPNVLKAYPGEENARKINEIQIAFFPGIAGAEKHLWQRNASTIPENVPLVRINLAGLSNDEEQQAAQYYNILSWEWSQLRSRRYSGQRTIIFTDECHVLAKDHDAIAMLRDMAQRIRKYGGSLFTSTQHVSDLMAKDIREIGEGIINSSAYRFFSKSEGSYNSKENPTNAYWVKSLLKATDQTMEELSNAGRGDFILCAGSQAEEWVHIEKQPWLDEYVGKASGQ